ncbi:MAG: VOC family protein [Bacteroidota bacterium]
MDLGAFSISLAVRDLPASRDFYRHLGFEIAGGDMEADYLIMRNGEHVIGLFCGMFEDNIITFNPGWDQYAQPVDDFTDVRDLADALRAKGVEVRDQSGDDSIGPGSFVVVDPDGNPVLIDQHV